MSDQAIMGRKGQRVSGVVRAQLAPEVIQDLQALEWKATEVRLRFTAVTEFFSLISDTNSG